MNDMDAKQKFIGEYLDKKMKGHGLPMGMAYYNLLSKTEDEAEKKWNIKQRKIKKPSVVKRRMFPPLKYK